MSFPPLLSGLLIFSVLCWSSETWIYVLTKLVSQCTSAKRRKKPLCTCKPDLNGDLVRAWALRSVQSIGSSSMSVGFFQVLWFPPNCQKHADSWIGYEASHLSIRECVWACSWTDRLIPHPRHVHVSNLPSSVVIVVVFFVFFQGTLHGVWPRVVACGQL